MGLDDRDYSRGPGNWRGEGGGRRAFRHLMERGDNPFAWSLPLFTAMAIRVRVHIVFVLFIVFELLGATRGGGIGVLLVAISMGLLFGIVLLHEFGHCIACRRVGGEANEILMWPLGGLAFCSPPHNWWASFVTTAGGPMVNVLLVPVTGAAVVVMYGFDALMFSVLQPVASQPAGGGYLGVAVWWAYVINWVLLGFNVLVPMYPMDGGRLLQALLWRKMGFERSMLVAATVGIGAAMTVGALALVSGNMILLVIALLGGLVCWQERKKVEMLGPAVASVRAVQSPTVDVRREVERKGKQREKVAIREMEEQAEIDRILAKIKQEGMGALTKKEKRLLEGATKRSQAERRGV